MWEITAIVPAVEFTSVVFGLPVSRPQIWSLLSFLHSNLLMRKSLHYYIHTVIRAAFTFPLLLKHLFLLSENNKLSTFGCNIRPYRLTTMCLSHNFNSINLNFKLAQLNLMLFLIKCTAQFIMVSLGYHLISIRGWLCPCPLFLHITLLHTAHIQHS